MALRHCWIETPIVLIIFCRSLWSKNYIRYCIVLIGGVFCSSRSLQLWRWTCWTKSWVGRSARRRRLFQVNIWKITWQSSWVPEWRVWRSSTQQKVCLTNLNPCFKSFFLSDSVCQALNTPETIKHLLWCPPDKPVILFDHHPGMAEDSVYLLITSKFHIEYIPFFFSRWENPDKCIYNEGSCSLGAL